MAWSTSHMGLPRQLQEEGDSDSLSVYDQRTLYLVNIFIVNTTRFLNRFSAVCEEKLADIHRRVLRVDATLTLLEAKLSSIDDVARESAEADQLKDCGLSLNQDAAQASSSNQRIYDVPSEVGESRTPDAPSEVGE